VIHIYAIVPDRENQKAAREFLATDGGLGRTSQQQHRFDAALKKSGLESWQ
jgi:hypothetical protein